MSSPAITRKRSRAQLLEEDELAMDTEQSTPPLSGIKKRKLNTYGKSPATGPSSLSRKISGLFGFGKNEKENVRMSEEADELGDEKDIFDVPDDEDENTNRKGRSTPSRNRSLATPKKTTLTAQKGSGRAGRNTATTNEQGGDIYEVVEDEPTITRSSSKKGVSCAKKPRDTPGAVKRSHPEVVIKSPAQPRKSRILKEDKKLSNKVRRESLLAAEEHEKSSDDEPAEEISVPKKRGRPKKQVEPEVEPSPPAEIQVQSTGKKRGRPKKVLNDIVESGTETPRGILTPSKGRPGRPRKSVAFEKADEALQLGFKDVPKVSSSRRGKGNAELSPDTIEDQEDSAEEDTPKPSSKGLKSKKVPAAKEDVDSEDKDDTACGVCSGLLSTKRNPILLCDGDRCDFAAHKDCYQVARIPKGDWFCRTCQPDTSSEVIFAQLDHQAVSKGESSNVPDIEGFETHLQRMQQIILRKLTGQKRIQLQGHDEVMQKVHQVVEQTVLAGEGNSMLVIGARGCGKTTLVESVISELSSTHRENFHVVRLNGFIHTDDKLALKETWRQLGREMEVDDDVVGKTSNYADTLASLLALLSHPSEISESAQGQIAKSVIFVLDEFDLFTTHPRQTLLYNLFDIAQARKAPIVVLGLTTRIDVVESLEKRVKSRFSHRYVHLSLPKSLLGFWDICKQALTVDTEEPDAEGFDTGVAGQEEFLSYWHSMIDDLFRKDAIFKRHIQSHFYRTKSVPEFFTSCIQPVINISPTTLPLTGRTFLSSPLSLAAPDSKLHVIQGLSELEIALLIAAARLDVILDTDTCNFAMAYDEYSSLTSRHKIQTSSSGVTALGASAKVWGREVALGAWERLANYELLVPAGIGGGGNRDSGAAGRMWKIDVGLEEITGSVEGLSGIMTKWCREI